MYQQFNFILPRWIQETKKCGSWIPLGIQTLCTHYPHPNCSLFSQGASALQTVELDSEKGPQLRVREGQEHAAFLSLWSGNMVIYRYVGTGTWLVVVHSLGTVLVPYPQAIM